MNQSLIEQFEKGEVYIDFREYRNAGKSIREKGREKLCSIFSTLKAWTGNKPMGNAEFYKYSTIDGWIGFSTEHVLDQDVKVVLLEDFFKEDVIHYEIF